MIHIFLKEVNSFLNSLIAYIVISVFLTGTGLIMWVFPETSVLNYGFADMEILFSFGPYVFMFLIPALTMRMFAEEKKNGTIELLMTKPLTDYDIIGGKYLAGLLLLLISLLPTLLYYYSIYQLGNPSGNIDTAGVMGSYIGLFLLGALFTSIGIFSSALSENQVVSFVTAMFLCFILYYGFQSISGINVWSSYSSIIEQIGVFYHYNFLSKGLIDLKNIVYFLSVILFMLSLTKFVLTSRKW